MDGAGEGRVGCQAAAPVLVGLLCHWMCNSADAVAAFVTGGNGQYRDWVLRLARGLGLGLTHDTGSASG